MQIVERALDARPQRVERPTLPRHFTGSRDCRRHTLLVRQHDLAQSRRKDDLPLQRAALRRGHDHDYLDVRITRAHRPRHGHGVLGGVRVDQRDLRRCERVRQSRAIQVSDVRHAVAAGHSSGSPSCTRPIHACRMSVVGAITWLARASRR